MLNPKPHSPLPVLLPPYFQNAWCLKPFTTLASCSPRLLQNSRLIQTLNTLSKASSQAFSRLRFLLPILTSLQVLFTVGILLTACFASTNIIGLVTVLACLVTLGRFALEPRILKPNWVDFWVMLFFALALVATCFSSYVHTSLMGLAKFSVFGFGYLHFRFYIGEKPDRLWWLLGLLLFCGTAESLIGFYQYINHIQPLATWQDTSINPEDQLTRIFGTLQPSNPNLLAGFLIPCVAAGLILLTQTLYKQRYLPLLLTLGGTLCCFVALVLTGSRGAYLSIIIMTLTSYAYWGHLLWHEPDLKSQHLLRGLWKASLLIMALGVALAFAALPAIRHRFLSIFVMREDSSNSYRMNVWVSTWEMIKDNWLLGIGPGNETFKQVYGLYMTPGYNALSAYSIFLEIWAEQGILGLLVFLTLMVHLKYRMFLSWFSTLSCTHKLMLGGLYTGIVGSVVYGLFDTIWYRPSVNLLFWLLVASFSVWSVFPGEEADA